ncbi:MAG TPA: hypothetical protein VK778_09600 [Solirubrobacteraceae bacterium]|jgi:hypothetical protein|nr:hypothetical protein [Solirubrobacteraceae bacterium]
MSPFLPAPLDSESGFNRRQLDQLRRAEAANELEIRRYGMAARARSEMDQLDTWAGHDAADTAATAELKLLRKGLLEAAGSAAGVELVASWVNQFSSSNHRRYGRRFGG